MKNGGKQILIIAGAIPIMIAGSLSVNAAVPGWTRSGEEWNYLASDGSLITDAWRESKGYFYYLDSEGKILKDTFFSWKGEDYYVDSDGRMVKDTWRYISAEESGWRYFGSDGAACRKKHGTVVHDIGGKRYIFDENGVLLTGWISREGNPVTDEDPFKEGVYFALDDGALLTDSWLDYYSVHAGGSGAQSELFGRSYRDFDNMWLYFDFRSQKIFSGSQVPKEREVKGGTYQFDENGVINPWWGNIATVSNANRSNPTTLDAEGHRVGTKFFDGSIEGALARNEWLWMYPSQNMNLEDSESIEASWWRTDGRGKVLTNSIRKVNDRYYAFDGLGRMQSGFVLFDGKEEFVAQYNVDAWKKEDFIEGNIYGVEKSDLYFFSNDELNDGSMKTGEVYIDIEDGSFAFGFGSDGKAIGGRNRMKMRNDSYYINGLRLDAPEELGLAVVKSTLPTGEVCYRAVNSLGKTVKGHKRCIKDSQGGYYMLMENCVVGYTSDEYKPVYRAGSQGIGFYHYDKKAKDKYAGGLFGGSMESPDFSELPEDARLNF